MVSFVKRTRGEYDKNRDM